MYSRGFCSRDIRKQCNLEFVVPKHTTLMTHTVTQYPYLIPRSEHLPQQDSNIPHSPFLSVIKCRVPSYYNTYSNIITEDSTTNCSQTHSLQGQGWVGGTCGGVSLRNCMCTALPTIILVTPARDYTLARYNSISCGDTGNLQMYKCMYRSCWCARA